MDIKKEVWAQTPDGKTVYKYTLTNSKGASVTLSNIGAAIVSIMVPDRDGKLADVVLGYVLYGRRSLLRQVSRSFCQPYCQG